jgi:hypothetical protein
MCLCLTVIAASLTTPLLGLLRQRSTHCQRQRTLLMLPVLLLLLLPALLLLLLHQELT